MSNNPSDDPVVYRKDLRKKMDEENTQATNLNDSNEPNSIKAGEEPSE